MITHIGYRQIGGDEALCSEFLRLTESRDLRHVILGRLSTVVVRSLMA